MSIENKSDSIANGNKPNNGMVGNLDEPVSVRLPGHYVMMTKDGAGKDGKHQDGGVGIKSGDKWTWFTYTDIKKIIDMCKVCKVQFNAQLENERKRAGVEDL